MLNDKKIKPGTASSLPLALSTRSDRKWRRLARLRNGSILCVLVSLVGLGLYMLSLSQDRDRWQFGLIITIHTMKRLYGNYLPPTGWLDASTSVLVYRFSEDTAFALGDGFIGSFCLMLLSQFLLTKHVRRTFQSRDVTHLAGWIHHLLGSIGPDATTRNAQQLNAEMRAALLEQLPQLTEETAFLLRPGDRNTLYRTLYGRDTKLIATVLQVVPILSDARALRGVQHLADGKGAARTHPELKEEAQSCLTSLQAALSLRSSSQGLLRASQPPPTPPEELLLPAQANHETAPSELLRADPQK